MKNLQIWNVCDIQKEQEEAGGGGKKKQSNLLWLRVIYRKQVKPTKIPFLGAYSNKTKKRSKGSFHLTFDDQLIIQFWAKPSNNLQNRYGE